MLYPSLMLSVSYFHTRLLAGFSSFSFFTTVFELTVLNLQGFPFWLIFCIVQFSRFLFRRFFSFRLAWLPFIRDSLFILSHSFLFVKGFLCCSMFCINILYIICKNWILLPFTVHRTTVYSKNLQNVYFTSMPYDDIIIVYELKRNKKIHRRSYIAADWSLLCPLLISRK